MDYTAEAKRNRFFRGKRMQAEEFSIEQGYGIERRRLVNRTVLGWGVAAGFELSQPGKPKEERPPRSDAKPEQSDALSSEEQQAPADVSIDGTMQVAGTPHVDQQPVKEQTPQGEGGSKPEKHYPLVVGEGFGLDKVGREVVREETLLDKTNTFLIAKNNDGGWSTRDLSKLVPGDYTLAVHYAEEKSGAVVPAHICGCGRPERGYVTETAIFSLRERVKDCGCGDPACADDECEDCVHDACIGDVRGPHARLSQWINDHRVGYHSHLHCWDRYDVALHERIDLACIHVEPAARDCDPFEVVIHDRSGPRRLVKNNDLLFDLIRGRDLTRISEISWQGWHRRVRPRVSWDDFRDWVMPSEFDKGQTRFTFKFSKPVKVDSVRPDACVMTAFVPEGGVGALMSYGVPIVDLIALDARPSPEGDLATEFRLEVDTAWLRDEVEDGTPSHLEDKFHVEIEIRGDLIEDCSGLQVDANKNGTPGGIFISRFRVKGRPERTSDNPKYD
jgi:hypothetical protein